MVEVRDSIPDFRESILYIAQIPVSLLVSKAMTQTSPSLHVWDHTNLQVPHLYSLSLSLFLEGWWWEKEEEI